MSLIEVKSKLTAQNQTTIPVAVRRALDLSELDQIRFVISKSGKVSIEKDVVENDDEHIDPMVVAYLDFLETDIIKNPQRLQPLKRHKSVTKLLEGVEADFDLDFDSQKKRSAKK